MSIINLNDFYSFLLDFILKDVIVGEGTLKCRAVCKHWKTLVDERIFKIIVQQLQDKIKSIPAAFGLRNIVIQFTDEVNPINKMTFTCDVQKVQQFCNALSTAIGPKAKKLITSAEEINTLIQKDTNLHILWEAIQKEIDVPSLETIEEISFYMSENTDLLDEIISIDLSGVQMTSVPEEFKFLTNLQFLYLNDNFIKSVPWEIGNFEDLQRLHLSNNELKCIPREVKNLSNLQFCYLDRNQLEALPSELGECRNLIELDLSNNQLKAVPRELGNCLNLQYLYLCGNQLKKIPKDFKRLNALQFIGLWDNEIKQDLVDEMAHDLSILEDMSKCVHDCLLEDKEFQTLEIIELFKQLSENGKNKLATYFFLHNQEKFSAENRNHTGYATEILSGNPDNAEFLIVENICRPLVELIVEIASSNDVEEDVPLSDAELAIAQFLSSLRKPITWHNKEPVKLKEFAVCGIKSLDDLNLLVGVLGPSKELQQITCPSMNWDLVEKAKSTKDLLLMQKAVVNACSDFTASCSTMIAFINIMIAKTQASDLGLASIETMKVVAGEIENLNGVFHEATNSPHKVWQYFQDPSQWLKLQAHFTDILNKLKELELDHQAETISAYFNQHMLVSFWKENANKSLSQLLKDRNGSVAELFKLTREL